MSKEKIGLFFGTFDPIHNGHLKIAKYITEEKLADKVWLVVTPENPIKVGSKISSFNHRFNMAKIATENYDNIIPSDLEVNLKKPNYTIDTLEYISNKLKDIEFSLIIGEDNYKIFDTWKDYKKIINKYKIFIYPRKGTLNENLHIINENTMYIGGPRIDLSSTNIRKIVSNNSDPKDLISNKVMEYINSNKLYQ
ncbi:MAG: nicotinate (nicotinamide) nucleotide adenylyltransferase [Bacteroidota bacterium]|jgi:nicotinate-nucleotide adenylyltransferase|nr:nicotinate (nicotinamide) nucleotide adenylyltransferase [Bacteroidota bacterium]|tara:strand:- start:602 stop:1186 length:585 start_codon:yes stop_codon:yes gene_type:complete